MLRVQYIQPLIRQNRFYPSLYTTTKLSNNSRNKKYFSTTKLCRNFDDHKFSVITSPINIDPVKGVTVPEFLWQNLHKWENSNAFVRNFFFMQKNQKLKVEYKIIYFTSNI